MRANWTSNLLLKALAFLVAVLIWNTYRTEEKSIQVFTVPLKFQQLPRGLELTGEIPRSLNVRVEGPQAVIRDLRPDRIDLVLDLSGLSPGEQFIRVTPDNLRVPPRVEVKDVTPDLIPMTVERLRAKRIQVEPRLDGKLAVGYEIGEVTLSPATVTVEGAASEVEATERAETAPIDISGQRDTFQRSVAVLPDNTKVRLVDVTSTIATVEIREVPIERGFLFLPVRVENARGEASSEPAMLGVTVKGTPSVLDRLTATNFHVLVNAEGLGPRREPYDLKPTIHFVPPNLGRSLEIVEISQEAVRVRIQGN